MVLKKLLLLFVAFFFLCASPASAGDGAEGFTHEETIRLGEKMYRNGILPSGEPMKAIVMGDIPVTGTMFTCDDCHQRSGLGSEEGTIITWPTNGKELYAPRRRDGAYKPPETAAEKQNVRRQLPEYYQIPHERPAYTDQSLARVIRLGVDSEGNKLDRAMPKYPLNKRDMSILIYYLKHLSVHNGPGVDETTLHFATVITDEVPEKQQQAMLSVLQAHIDARNVQSRHERKRYQAGPFYKSQRHRSYRQLELHRWVLSGPEKTWRKQLEHYYQQQPVFALLGGITTERWDEIHRFSEDNKIPCIFPVTELPKISKSDWYTLYFSQGFYQEGKSAAKFLRSRLPKNTNTIITQIYFEQDKRGTAIAKGFSETWLDMGGKNIDERVLKTGEELAPTLWEELSSEKKERVLLIWTENIDKDFFTTLLPYVQRDQIIFGSANLLKENRVLIPEQLRKHVFLTYPYSLPEDIAEGRRAVDGWLSSRNIELIDLQIQAKMYFLGWMLPGALKSMRSEFFREYFLERYDMMTDQDYAIPIYPRLTFGPGQRYASKGCYIVQLTGEQEASLQPVSDWIIY